MEFIEFLLKMMDLFLNMMDYSLLKMMDFMVGVLLKMMSKYFYSTLDLLNIRSTQHYFLPNMMAVA